jgi:hypothetical protein
MTYDFDLAYGSICLRTLTGRSAHKYIFTHVARYVFDEPYALKRENTIVNSILRSEQNTAYASVKKLRQIG